MGRTTVLLLVALSSAIGGCDALDRFHEAKETVSQGMLDPGATQFRALEVCSEDREVIRGEFNAKNAYGAYVGFKSFYYANNIAATADKPEFMTLMQRCFGKYAGAPAGA